MDTQLFKMGAMWVSKALLTERFACDLATCKGQCCVDGDSGAPLEEEEVDTLIREYPSFAPYMTPLGQQVVKQQGVAVRDLDGEWETPLVAAEQECVYATFDVQQGVEICLCAIERAHLAGKTTFRKPISCWLYPIRIQNLSQGVALYFHQWHLCSGASLRGQREGIPVYRFLQEPITAKFGARFYEELEATALML